MTVPEPLEEAARQRHLEGKARRVDALPVHWDDKLEVWQEETALSETTLDRILRRWGENVPE